MSKNKKEHVPQPNEAIPAVEISGSLQDSVDKFKIIQSKVPKSCGPPGTLYRARSAYKASRTNHLSLEIMEPVVISEVDLTCWWVRRLLGK